MTPKEKAKELALEFRFRIDEYFQPDEWELVDYHNIQLNNAAKDSALYAVEIILDEVIHDVDDFEYWNQVHDEIEKL